jgi:hypothetical protein
MTNRLQVPKHGFVRLLLLLFAALVVPALSAAEKNAARDVLWRAHPEVARLNLLDGIGGRGRAPKGPFTFQKEDLAGSNPKMVVIDSGGVKWKLKAGAEAKAETAATRLVWAAGYFADDDYYLANVRITEAPSELKRFKGILGADGILQGARFERDVEHAEKETWRWKDNAFTGTREFNGLRVMMALINNWDLKDVNNHVHLVKRGSEIERDYVVTDMGASFGPTHIVKGLSESRGNLAVYQNSPFIKRADDGFVDLATPARPTILAAVRPGAYISRIHMQWIRKDIPRADAKWTGQVLSRLSPRQIRDAFRAAGYSEPEVEVFARVIELRIAELNAL